MNEATNATDPSGKYLYAADDRTMDEIGLWLANAPGHFKSKGYVGPGIGSTGLRNKTNGNRWKIEISKEDAIRVLGDPRWNKNRYMQLMLTAAVSPEFHLLARLQDIKYCGGEKSATIFTFGKVSSQGEDLPVIASKEVGWWQSLVDAGDFVAGLGEGFATGGTDFFRSLGKLAAKFFTDLPGMVSEIVQGVGTLVTTLASGDFRSALKQFSEPLHELVFNWTKLSYNKKGYYIGHLIGEYGVGFVTGAATAKILHHLRNLRGPTPMLAGAGGPNVGAVGASVATSTSVAASGGAAGVGINAVMNTAQGAGAQGPAPNRMPREDRFPTRDDTGRLHTPGSRLPDRVPRDLRPGEIRDAIAEARGSLTERRAEQARRQPSPQDILHGRDRDLTPRQRQQRGHDQRIVEEERWLRLLEERLRELER